MGKSVFRVFCIELGVWKVCKRQEKCSSLFVFVEGTHQKKKSPENPSHLDRTEETAENMCQTMPCSGMEELVGLPLFVAL